MSWASVSRSLVKKDTLEKTPWRFQLHSVQKNEPAEQQQVRTFSTKVVALNVHEFLCSVIKKRSLRPASGLICIELRIIQSLFRTVPCRRHFFTWTVNENNFQHVLTFYLVKQKNFQIST